MSRANDLDLCERYNTCNEEEIDLNNEKLINIYLNKQPNSQVLVNYDDITNIDCLMYFKKYIDDKINYDKKNYNQIMNEIIKKVPSRPNSFGSRRTAYASFNYDESKKEIKFTHPPGDKKTEFKFKLKNYMSKKAFFLESPDEFGDYLKLFLTKNCTNRKKYLILRYYDKSNNPIFDMIYEIDKEKENMSIS